MHVWKSQPPKMMVLADGASGRCLNHADGTHRSGTSVLLKKRLQRASRPSHHGRTQQEVCGPEKSPHPARLHPNLEYPASESGRNQFLLFISTPVCSILLQWLEETRLRSSFCLLKKHKIKSRAGTKSGVRGSPSSSDADQ